MQHLLVKGMRFAPGAAASSALKATLLSLGHRTDVDRLFYAMHSVDYARYLEDKLHHQCMAGIDNPGILLHPVTSRRQDAAVQFRSAASCKTILAES